MSAPRPVNRSRPPAAQAAEAAPAGTASPPAAGFSAEWLQQREPFDAQARQDAAGRLHLLRRLQAYRNAGPTAGRPPWRVIDLACGTGANLRWLAPRLGGPQQWLAVDHDAALLARWPQRAAAGTPMAQPLRWTGRGFECTIVQRQLDLAQQLESLPWAHAQLVSASALLDLVSAAWLQRLVGLARAHRPALLFALSVNGQHGWAPRDRHDALVGRLFAAHQQRDKGFGGPGLGAAAVPLLRQALQATGYRVHIARSDWLLDSAASPQAWALQQALLQGMAQAAVEQAPSRAAQLQAWLARRLAAGPGSRLRVGHLDLLALPAG